MDAPAVEIASRLNELLRPAAYAHSATDLCLIETHISEDDGRIDGYFIVLPDPLEIQRLVAVLKSRQ